MSELSCRTFAQVAYDGDITEVITEVNDLASFSYDFGDVLAATGEGSVRLDQTAPVASAIFRLKVKIYDPDGQHVAASQKDLELTPGQALDISKRVENYDVPIEGAAATYLCLVTLSVYWTVGDPMWLEIDEECGDWQVNPP